ncbi:MAG: hypothetical protein RIQ47_561 [Bacteroidota bacterium]|jgi:hypothetical protein
MKKLLLALFTCAGLLTSSVTSAQMAAGTLAPDFTGTDLNGNTWNLYTLLDSGKTVFIDVSATWCGPCWSFHNTGRLESLYNTYGPPGTNEIMVLFVEGDGSTTLADLQGTGSNTQGDWITGTPYPIIDDASIGNILDINYFPTIYMICPDRIIKEVGQLSSVAAFMTQKNSNCFTATETNDGGITNSMSVLNGTLASCNPVDISYRLCNYGTAPMTSATINLDLDGTPYTSFNWTGSLNTYESTVLSFTGVNPTTSGTVVATVTATNPNGSTDAVAGNDSRTVNVVKFASVGTTLAPQNFSLATFPPANWLQLSPSTGAIFSRSSAGNNGAGSAKMDFWSASNGTTDVLQLPQIDLTATANPIMTFDVSHSRYQTSNDGLRVKVSTNCGLTWMTLYNKAGAALSTTAATSTAFTPSTTAQWRNDTVNLSNYATNPNVFIRFEAVSNYGNNAYVDNVQIISNSTTGIGEIAQAINFEVYPNPASERSSVDFVLDSKQDVIITLYNQLGEAVYTRTEASLSTGEYTFEIPTAGLSSGVYMVNVKAGQASSMKKLIVK